MKLGKVESGYVTVDIVWQPLRFSAFAVVRIGDV